MAMWAPGSTGTDFLPPEDDEDLQAKERAAGQHALAAYLRATLPRNG